MCGISVLIAKNLKPDYMESIKNDAANMHSRGPDFQKIIKIGNHIIAGHTRLAINGLSKEFNQPYTTDDEHYLIFNGEIYDFRNEFYKLESDTKYLYDNLLAANGDLNVIKHFLKKCDGVWAFAFIAKDYAIISRDILGEKPLYRHESIYEQTIIFSSLEKTNIKNIKKNEHFPSNSISKIIFNTWEEETLNIIENNKDLLINNDIGFQSGFEKYLEISVKNRLNCDVPVACTLSGGLDSSVIAALANKYSEGEVTFFTSVPNVGESEYTYAKYVADKLQKPLEVFEYSIEMYFDSLAKNLNEFPSIIKSPSSIIHLMLMKKIHNAGFKVCLDGQGADEYLGGYRHQTVEWLLYKFINTLNFKYTFKLGALLLKEKQFNLYYHTLKKIFHRDFNTQDRIIYNSLFYNPLPSLLSYTDFVSMSNSIEVRTPFLNLDLINFTRFHKDFQFSYPKSKTVLRNILDKNQLNLISNRTDKLGYELPWAQLCKFIRSKDGQKYMPAFNLKTLIQHKIILRYFLFRFSLYFMPKIAIYSHFKLSKTLGFTAKN
jgi:asparagine synthase (glutamine-hydrolysing)